MLRRVLFVAVAVCVLAQDAEAPAGAGGAAEEGEDVIDAVDPSAPAASEPALSPEEQEQKMKEYQERVAYVLEHVPAHCKAELTELLSTPPEQQAPGAGLSEECQPLVERAAQAHARETGAGGAPAGERPARGGAAAGGAPKRAAKAAGAKAPKPTRAPRGARRGGRYFSTETTIAVTVVALTLVPIGALVLYAFWRASARKVAAAAALEKIKTEDAEAWEAALAEAVAEEARRAKRAAAEEKEIKAGRKRPAAAQPAPGGAGLPGMPALGQ